MSGQNEDPTPIDNTQYWTPPPVKPAGPSYPMNANGVPLSPAILQWALQRGIPPERLAQSEIAGRVGDEANTGMQVYDANRYNGVGGAYPEWGAFSPDGSMYGFDDKFGRDGMGFWAGMGDSFHDMFTNPAPLMMITAGLASGIGMGAAGAGMAAGDAVGAGSAAGYAGLDAASAATLGGGYGVAGGTALGAGELGAGLGAAGAGGFLGDATAAGYGGLDAASASTLGGGFSVDGGTALGSMGAGGGYGSASDLFSNGFTDGGTAGGALDTGYANGGLTAGGTSAADTIVKSATDAAGNPLSKAALDGTNAFGANSVPGAYDLAGAGTGLLGNLSGKDLLGLGSAAVGALAGSKGTEQNTSSVRDIPEWLKPYANQALGAASGLLAQQTAPGAMQGYQDMRNVGQGLLATPQMGNGFNRFFPGR